MVGDTNGYLKLHPCIVSVFLTLKNRGYKTHLKKDTFVSVFNKIKNTNPFCVFIC